MPTEHINANIGDFAKVVLMPGDPKRAKWMAETFLTDYKLVNDVRGALAFTGKTKNGKTISIMASGMGIPSIGLYSYELYTYFNVETIIRVGTAGAYQPYINLRDILIAQSASTDSSWANQYNLCGTFSATADPELLIAAYNICAKNNIPFHGGNILSSDVFYDSNKDSWKKWEEMGVLGVEMEAYGLYCNAAKLHKRALCILTTSNSFHKVDMLTSEQRQSSLTQMIETAIEVAEQFA